MAEADKQQQRRIERDLRQRRQHAHDRPHDCVERRIDRGREANTYAQDDRDGKSRKQPKQGGRDLLPKTIGHKLMEHPREYLAGRRKQRHRRIAERHQRLPHGNNQRNWDQPEQEIGCDGAHVHE